MNILVTYGTRPEAIKLAPVVHELRRRREQGADFHVRLCSTGQHRELLHPVAEFLGMVPDVNLDLMEPDQTLSSLTARALLGLDRVLTDPAQPRPDVVMVQGDTTTALCGALAAFYRRIDVAHVEAGLRTHDLHAPYPEEVNRRIISQIATYNFAPTPEGRRHLEAQPLARNQRVWVTGNTVIDTLLWAVEQARRLPPDTPWLARLADWQTRHPGGAIILVTGHRREHFGRMFESFCRGLARLARAHPEVLIVYPLHLNPNVQAPARRILGALENVHLEDPRDYLAFVALMDRCRFVITDSGGIQEEAPSLGKPVLVTREVTERPEAVEAGTVRVIGSDEDVVFAEAHRLLTDPAAHAAMATAVNPYGDGQASRRIVDILEGKSPEEFHPRG